MAVLFAWPAICFMVLSGWKSGTGLLPVMGVLLAGYGACLYFSSDRDADRRAGKLAEVPARKKAAGEAQDNSKTVPTPWLDFAMILLVPVTVVPGNLIAATATDSGNNTSEFSACSLVEQTSTPPRPSLCPLRNLVVECKTMSAPRESGFWK